MHGVEHMNSWEPRQFIEYIDEQYQHAKPMKIRRASVEWGKWSREMNLVLRSLTEVPNHKDEMPTRFKYCFAYWINRSQLLELHSSGASFIYKRKKKMLMKQGTKIRYAAIDDPLPAKLAGFMQIAKNDLVTTRQSGVYDGRDN